MTETTAELVRKLRARFQHKHVSADKWTVIPDPLCQAAADMIESLTADVGVKDQRNAD